MRVLESSVDIPLPARQYWALRLDDGFDAFCARADGCFIQPVSFERTTDANGLARCVAESRLVYEENPVPASLRHMLGTETFAFVSRSAWYADRFDAAHPAEFDSTPPVLKDRISVRGRCWLEERSPAACRHVYRVEVDVRVFGLGSMAELAIERRLEANYARLGKLTLQYVRSRPPPPAPLPLPSSLPAAAAPRRAGGRAAAAVMSPPRRAAPPPRAAVATPSLDVLPCRRRRTSARRRTLLAVAARRGERGAPRRRAAALARRRRRRRRKPRRDPDAAAAAADAPASAPVSRRSDRRSDSARRCPRRRRRHSGAHPQATLYGDDARARPAAPGGAARAQLERRAPPPAAREPLRHRRKRRGNAPQEVHEVEVDVSAAGARRVRRRLRGTLILRRRPPALDASL